MCAKKTAIPAILFICGSVLLAAAEPASTAGPASNTNITLRAQCPAPFNDNAVLQRDIPLPVWGTSLPGAEVSVSFEKQRKTTTANRDGKWEVTLDPLTAVKLKSPNSIPEGKSLTIVTQLDGKTETRTLKNIVVGDVWICAGQSNMAGRLGSNRSGRYPEDTITGADYPGFRHMLMPKSEPWLVCTPETCSQFKKVAFFFGRGLYREALVPIGLVAAAVGGSRIETWLNQEPFEIGGNYQKLVAPIVGHGIRGAVWYQGESNTKDGLEYLPKLTSLIEGWRKAWRQGDFSVYIVQLPGCGNPPEGAPTNECDWAATRQAQFEALSVKNTGMAVTIDIGDRSVHPPNKYDTGLRLARVALHHTYGFEDLVPTGPLYKSHKIEGNAIRISFEYAAKGLMIAEKEGILPPKPTPGKKLGCLAIRAKDGAWHWADGTIESSELVVSCKDVKDPVAARYAYVDRPIGCMLYNRDGLPAAPFSTDAGK